VVTYNQEAYIAHCLQSLVDQVTAFDFEVIVSDDCSTDGTSRAISSFVERYPHIIRSVRPERNLGPFRNFTYVHGLARGDYVAHVDGDDYALPGKLQVQADFLDRNPWCEIVWHRMLLQHSSGGDPVPQLYDDQMMAGRRFDIHDAIRNVTIGLHSSKMYRRWDQIVVDGIDAVDFSENVLHLHRTRGQAAFVDAPPLGVYRTSIGISKNAWKIREKIYQWMAYFYANNIGDKRVICAKMLWMLLSDLKHSSKSWRYGLKVFWPMALSTRISQLVQCRTRRLTLS
jgi:glycosyltransferase involved in cell wall biosynthesis